MTIGGAVTAPPILLHTGPTRCAILAHLVDVRLPRRHAPLGSMTDD